MSPSAAPLWVLGAQFAFAALVIALAGYRLCVEGERIARATGVSGSWIGLALIATVTSLPELASGLSAVTVADVPDIAVGNALGACVFNLGFLVVLDLVYREQPLYRKAASGHILSAAFGIVLLGFIGLNIALGSADPASPALHHVGLYSPVLLLLYFVALRTVFLYERAAARRDEPAPASTLRGAALRFGAAAAAVVAAGVWLPFVADDLAGAMGWNRSFVGTLFVALATTLPEFAVTLSALRMGALDMAFGNLLGSNLFNAVIVAVEDLAYLPGPLLARVSPVHAITAFTAVVMSGLAVVGLLYRPANRVLRAVGWVSIGLAALSVSNAYVVYRYGR